MVNKNEEKENINDVLAESLSVLLMEKSFDKIKVIDICNEANVPRSTFYYHFNDKNELLKYTIKSISKRITDEVTDDSPDDFFEFISFFEKIVIESLNKHRTIFIPIFERNKNSAAFDMVLDIVCESLKVRLNEEVKKGNIKLSVPVDLIAEFYIGGVNRLVKFWLLNYEIYTTKDLYNALDNLLVIEK